MAYEPHDWQTGETITADKLNHIENGIMNNSNENNLVILPFDQAGNTIVTTLTYSDITDIYTKYQSGNSVILMINMGNTRATLFVTNITYEAAEYGNPESYIVNAVGTYSNGSPNNTYIYLVTVTFRNGAETVVNNIAKRISLID